MLTIRVGPELRTRLPAFLFLWHIRFRTLEKYLPYIEKHQPAAEVAEIMEFMEQEENENDSIQKLN